MASAARATTAAAQDVTASVAGASTSTWDRISTWASDNKVAAWTIAGVTVVVAGGSVYYLTRPVEAQESSDSASTSSEKKSAKKSKKKAAKKDVEKAAEEAVPESKPGRWTMRSAAKTRS
jgi:import receptor subunit TOM70